MIYTKPSFYDSFSCIGSKCAHNCCIGWEIDVDPAAAALYRTVGGALGKELAEKITDGPEPHFRLEKDGRCPFLNEDNLCRIILSLGENGLCDICALHPRFFNSFPGREESGLGLCCEEAVRLLLSAPEGFELTEEIEPGGEEGEAWVEHLAELRQELFAILADDKTTFAGRVSACGEKLGLPSASFKLAEWIRFYLELERMDGKWGEMLEQRLSVPLHDSWRTKLDEARYGRILSYFLYRHFLTAETEEEGKTVFLFCVLGTVLIASLDALDPAQSDEHLRLYSAEIEYSDENVERICSKLRERFAFDGVI